MATDVEAEVPSRSGRPPKGPVSAPDVGSEPPPEKPSSEAPRSESKAEGEKRSIGI